MNKHFQTKSNTAFTTNKLPTKNLAYYWHYLHARSTFPRDNTDLNPVSGHGNEKMYITKSSKGMTLSPKPENKKGWEKKSSFNRPVCLRYLRSLKT